MWTNPETSLNPLLWNRVHRMKIEVVPYDENWPSAFESEKRQLLEKVESGITRVHHIGSTSVPNLSAKPIIDIMIEATSLEALDLHKSGFEALGYEVMGEFGMAGRRYYRKGGDDRTHQIHAFTAGDENLHRHLAFRDYLIAHPDISKEYGRLKIKVAGACNHDIDRYCDGKNSFVQEYEAKALKWRENAI